MRHFIFSAVFCAFLAFMSPLTAQQGGGGGSTSEGSDGGSEFGEGTEVLEFQGFTQQVSDYDFVGRPNANAPFVGREEIFENRAATNRANQGSTRRSTTSTANRRTTTARRATGTRAMGASRLGSTTGGRQVRAATTTDFDFAAAELNAKAAAIQTRLARLPNLRVVPDDTAINIVTTPTGTVATVTGNVATEKDRKLLQQLILLEPGVDKVIVE